MDDHSPNVRSRRANRAWLVELYTRNRISAGRIERGLAQLGDAIEDLRQIQDEAERLSDCQGSSPVRTSAMPDREAEKPDTNTAIARAVERITGGEPVEGEDLLGSEEAKRLLREAKARAAQND